MKLSLFSLEAEAAGTVFVQLLKDPSEDAPFHRFPLTPGCDIEKMVAAQELSLQRGGYPALSDEDKAAIMSACTEAWSPEVVDSYNALVASQEAARAAWAADAAVPKSVEIARAMRAAAYRAPDGPDALFFKWQRDEATKDDWLGSIAAIKALYPDPVE